MKLDYEFIKKILIVCENQKNNSIKNYELMKQLNIMTTAYIDAKINQDLIDKYVGHIKLLCKNQILTTSAKDYGFASNAFGGYLIGNAKYELSMKGFGFLRMLKNDTVFNKIKNFAFSNAIEVGKQILIKMATNL